MFQLNPTLLPSHPDSIVEDRLSVCEQYSHKDQVPHWLFIKTLLLSRPMLRLDDLLEVISNCQYDLEFSTLKSVFPPDNQKNIISAIVKAALRIPELFPTGLLDVLTVGMAHTIALTREQIACLLAHMFLCTLKTPTWNKHWCTFGIWYAARSQPAEAYLQCLLAYFSELDTNGKPSNALEEVHFIRYVLESSPNWSASTSCFTDDILSSSLSLRPKPGCNVEVSFANKDVGFGVSGTQEEVKMGMSPEACVVMLLAPTLLDNEVLLTRGVKQVGLCEGIGRNVKFVGVETDESRDWNSRCIVAMDAMEIDCLDDDNCIVELNEAVLLRELNKAYCGFVSVGKEQVTIATGHWGCGAFGGNKFVKSLIQIMAACEANKRLVFHEFSSKSDHSCEKYFSEVLTEVVAKLSRRHVTVGQLFTALRQLDTKSSDVFGDVMCALSDS